MPTSILRRLLVLTLLVAPAVGLAAEQWPAWRGPRGDGVTEQTKLPTEWSRESEKVRWRVALPEPGNSTPVVWDERIFLTQPRVQDQRRTVMCRDRATGELLWERGVEYTENEPTHDTNFYCSASPVTDGQRVIVWYGSAGVYCYDMEGREVWHRALGPVTHPWGIGASPLLHGDRVFLNFGPGDPSFVVALDKRTGDELWRREVPHRRTQEGPTGLGPNGDASSTELYGSWSTPVVVRSGDRDVVVVTQPERVVAYDPETGKEVWSVGGLADLVYCSPIWDDKHLVAYGGYQGAALAVRLGGEGDVTKSHVVWREPRTRLRLGTGVLYDEKIFVSDMQGIVDCMDVATNKQQWRERLAATGGDNAVWSSMVRSGDVLYLLNQTGDTFVFRVKPNFELIEKNSLGEATNASLVPSQGEWLVRTHEALWCIGR